LADIVLDVGFADQSHFSRTFVAITGETPSGLPAQASLNTSTSRIS
jgi:AraC-like DNA-binding protein